MKLNKLFLAASIVLLSVPPSFGAKQSTYATKSAPVSGDKALITDSADSNKTKQVALSAFLVGDCTGFPCLDGSSDGGNIIKLYAGTGSYWTALQGGAPAANRSWRLPIAAPPSAGSTLVMTMDEYGQMGFLAKPSTSGYVLSSTDAGVLSWAANGSGSMSWPASDGSYYAAKDGAWASLASVYQPLDSDLTALSGLACTENQIPKKNSSNVWVCGSDIEGAGGGISHATSDGNYYASRNGAWASLTGLYAAALGADDNYVTDAEKTKLSNLSGTNTGDQSLTSLGIPGLATTGISGNLTITKTGTTARTVTFPDAAGTVALTSNIVAAPTDATITTTDVTTNNASTTKHGWLLKATAPASGLRNIVAIDNAETVYKNTALFDATSPSTQAFGDSASAGSAMTSARRDHKHAMPTVGTSAQYNVGTGANNIVQLNSSGQLPFTIDVSDLTDTDGLFSAKADASCFASESAFNACFDLTWATGGASNLDGLSDVVISGTPSNGQVLKYNGTNWVPDTDNTASGAGYVETPPTYSDATCTKGQYSFDTSYFYMCEATNQWDRFAVTWANWSNPTPVTPTLTSRVIGTNGTTLTLTGSTSLSVGSGGNGGFDVDCSTAGNGITATYSSGAPGTSLVYILGTTVNSGDTCDLDYTQPGNGIEATTGGADLASITSAAITNNSTQSAASPVVLGINSEASGIEDGFSAAGEIRISRIQASASGTVSSFYFYHAGETNWVGVIYSDNAGEPGSLLAKTASTAGSGFTWGWSPGVALNSTLNITSGTWYWHGVQVASSTNFGYLRKGATDARAYTATFNSPPSSWPTASDTDIGLPNAGVVSYGY